MKRRAVRLSAVVSAGVVMVLGSVAVGLFRVDRVEDTLETVEQRRVAAEARVAAQQPRADGWDPAKAMKKEELAAAQVMLAGLLPSAALPAEELLAELKSIGSSVGIADMWETPAQRGEGDAQSDAAFLKKLQARPTSTPKRVNTLPSVTLDLTFEADVRTVIALLEKIRARRQWVEVTRLDFTASSTKPGVRMILTFHYRSAGGT